MYNKNDGDKSDGKEDICWRREYDIWSGCRMWGREIKRNKM